MKYTFTHNPKKDISEVIPNQSIILDIDNQITIKDTGQQVTDNGIEQTSEIYGIARDNFEVAKAQDSIMEKVSKYHSKNNSKSTTESTQQGENS